MYLKISDERIVTFALLNTLYNIVVEYHETLRSQTSQYSRVSIFSYNHSKRRFRKIRHLITAFQLSNVKTQSSGSGQNSSYLGIICCLDNLSTFSIGSCFLSLCTDSILLSLSFSSSVSSSLTLHAVNLKGKQSKRNENLHLEICNS